MEHYERRFRNAQRVGRDAFRERTPGYFAFNAMPFGGRYIYKATWYVWRNPQSGQPQTVPLLAGDLASMRRIRNKDLDTRQATTRSVRTADNIQEQRRAIQRQDWPALQELQARMMEDGSLGEILSGFHGLHTLTSKRLSLTSRISQCDFSFRGRRNRFNNSIGDLDKRKRH